MTMTGSQPVLTQPISARVFLFGDSSVTEVAASLVDRDVLGDAGVDARVATSYARHLLDEQLAPMADSFLDVDLAAVAAAGWRLHEQLTAAARETRETEGLTTVVELVSHRIESTWHPRVDIVVGEKAVAHLTFELTVSFDLTGLSAAVTVGRLMRIGGGKSEVTVSFALGGRTLATRTAQFDPQLSVPLGTGLELLPAVAKT